MPSLSLPQLPNANGALPANVLTALAGAIEGEVRTGYHDRMLYATDASSYQVEPLGVVIPANASDVIKAARLASDHGLPMLPRGGGTSLAGQCTNRALVIDTSVRMTAIKSVDAEARRCTVEPGITIDDLNAAIAHTGLFFAPDPSTARQANVGGSIGNNAAGSHSVLYGRMAESVEAIEACLANGTVTRFEAGSRDLAARAIATQVVEIVKEHRDLIRERFPRTPRRNAGYALDMVLDDIERAEGEGRDPLDVVNLAKLLCGSEGTLAMTLSADLALHPLPKAKGLLLLGFNDLDAAIAAVEPLLETGPSAIELVDNVIIDLAMVNRTHRASAEAMPMPSEGKLRAVLYVEYFAQSIDDLRERLDGGVRVVAESDPTAGVERIEDPRAIGAAWALRKAGEPLLHGMVSDRKPVTFVEDNAVPVERLGEFVRRFRAIVEKHGTFAAFYAHASVGVLHVRPALDPRDDADERKLHAISVEVADLAKELGGVMSGEHGDGRVRGPLLERFYGPELMDAFARVKAVFDPQGLLNPGNIVGAPINIETITQRTRIRPEGNEVDVVARDTYFEYEDQHGFRGAVEMCNGAGVCRKKSGGVMCPSYMATLDERHSTRGRGNALRLATTGQLETGEADPWSDPGTMETLNLCLSCKACKSECPSNVDIARLKAEYTAQRFASKGRPTLQATVFGHVRTLNKLGSLTPGIANAVNRTSLAKWAAGKLLNLDERRSLPPFARSLMGQWKRAGLDRQTDRPRVLVFGDCFTMYNEPRIGLAAGRVLEAFGYRPVLIDAGCCARAMISTGLLDDAARTIANTYAKLMAADATAPIVVLEPSCLSAIIDDWVQLKNEVPLADRKALAARTFGLEAFLEHAWDEHPQRPTVEAKPDVYVHGHCHEKALRGIGQSRKLLERFANVRTADVTCCGMAGSFGFTKDRYDLSMKIGELGALPHARSAAADGKDVIASGTSCRHQMHDGAALTALHPAEWLDQVISGS
ncbi:MAG: FAD-linked oxidase C-terminal domain-containing protein [Phycisphaerales bacterium]|jgi:FAD/FMN-containing dehydrogenase/Fe-S oxidoreductase